MCLITAFAVIVASILYYLGFLDRPKFKVVESFLSGEITLSASSKDDADNKRLYAIVMTAQDPDYVDSNICKVLKATKRGIEASIATPSSLGNEANKNEQSPNGRSISMASSYSITRRNPKFILTDKADAKEGNKDATPHEDDIVGIAIFLQDPATGDCHETALGFLVEASSWEDAHALAKKVTTEVQLELGKPKTPADPPDRDDTECSSSDLGVPLKGADADGTSTQTEDIFQVHAVSLGQGPVLRGHIPVRTPLTFYLARYLHWGRAHAEYILLMATEEKKNNQAAGAVACEVYVQGQHNPAIGSAYVDYLYLLDFCDREAVWNHMDTAMPE